MKRFTILITIFLLIFLLGNTLKAQYISIPITGFTRDVVANGAATSTTSTTGSVDGTYVFIDSSYNPGSGVCQTTNVWPSNNIINSLTTSGLTYILQASNVFNDFQLLANSSGTLTITTPVALTNIYLLASGGGGVSTFNATVTFNDATNQVFSNLTVVDWCNGTSPASYQFYRTTRNTATTCSNTLCQYMYDVNLAINAANFSKTITSIALTNQTGSGRLNIFAVGGHLIGPCTTPSSQPTALNLNPGTINITGTYTPSSGNPGADHYLIIRDTVNTLTSNPVNGTLYSKGNPLGGGTVVAYQTGTSFTDSNLVAGIHYYYFVFAANSSCTGQCQYLTANPLKGDTLIWNGALTSSNLPIIVINTNNVTIPDSPKIPAHMGIIYNGPGVRNHITDPFNNYNNNIGIEVRGSSSQAFDQKQYSIETRDVNGIQMDTVVLGMPTENDWILYAPYDDKTCMRNTMTYALANRSGHYAVRTQFCEVVLNGQYMGVYVWMEKIKRDANRVNISKLTPADSTGDNLTGGYIFKIDKSTGSGGNDGWNSSYLTSLNHTVRFLYDSPDSTTLITPQYNYIKSYVDSFETALKATNFADPVNGYRKYMDVNSFIDYFFINEISNNVDGYRLSTYLYKNKITHGGKIVLGPVWDYNIAYGNANYNNGTATNVWTYATVESNTGDVPFWWARLMQDTVYKSILKCRWTQLRQTTLSNTAIFNYIDSTVNLLNEAQVRHFVKWPILGVYTWPNPSPYPTSYAGEITALKTYLSTRLAWLDANMPGTLTLPTVNLGNDTAVCPGGFVLNAGNPACTYLWNTGDTSQMITTNAVGAYTVSVNKNYGCIKTDTINITFKPVPVILAGNDTSICKGNTVSLNVTGVGTFAFAWNNGVIQGAPFVPLVSQYYTVTATGTNTCKSRDSVLVSLIPLPIKPIITIKWGGVDTLISSSLTGNQWYKNGNILLGENGQKLIVSSFVNGNYTVTATQNTCTSDMSDAAAIHVGIENYTDNCSFVVYPNPFKDKTTVTYNLKVSEYTRIAIYDVTGREVKVLTNSIQDRGEHSVDFDAALIKAGVYFYTINAGNDTFTGKLVKVN